MCPIEYWSVRLLQAKLTDMPIICHEQTDWSVYLVGTHLTLYLAWAILYFHTTLLCTIVLTSYKSKCNNCIDVHILLYMICIYILYLYRRRTDHMVPHIQRIVNLCSDITMIVYSLWWESLHNLWLKFLSNSRFL